MQRVLQTLSILSLLTLGSCICAPRGHGQAGKCPYLAKQAQACAPQQACAQSPCGPSECKPGMDCGPGMMCVPKGPGGGPMNGGGPGNGGPAGCEPVAMELLGRVDRLEQRINELMRRFDEHQGAMNNGGGPRMQPMPQGPQRRMRASRPDGVQREARVEGMQKGLQQNIDRRVIEVRSVESDGDPRAMLEELREQLQQMKSQMMKMRKDQGGANAEQG
ncbi:MAG: hypothetical protein RL277_1266 [Planctomycetota bacterium]